MKFPDEILNAARSAADRHREDVPQAVDAAYEAVTRLPVYRQWSEGLIRQALQDLIYEERHKANRAMRWNAGDYGRPAKVVVGESAEVRAAHRSLWNYYVAGTTLGKIRVGDLGQIALSEERTGSGYLFRAALLRKLEAASAKADRNAEVGKVVSEKKLAQCWREAEEETGVPADDAA